MTILLPPIAYHLARRAKRLWRTSPPPPDSKFFFFKEKQSHEVILRIKKFLRTLSYLKPAYKDDTKFDADLKAVLIEYQTRHLLDQKDGSLNAEVYAQMGSEMTDAVLEATVKSHPGLEWLLYDTRLAALRDTWDPVPAFIAEKDFIGWGHAGCEENCYDYARLQIQNAGFDVKSPWWGDSKKMSPDIHQIYLTKSVAGMHAGNRVAAFAKGVAYLKDAIKNNVPVMVGVEDGPGSPNADKVTDHFVTVVGMGTDTGGQYFHFYDNATPDVKEGTSPKNKIYCNCSVPSLKGTGPNAYIQNSAHKGYTVTQIRETKT